MGSVRIAALLTALVLLAAACGSDDGASEPSTTVTTAASTTVTTATPPPTTATTVADTTTTAADFGSATAYTTTLQLHLKALGFFDGATDGILGPVTVEAIKAFQADAGLTADGAFGPKTQAALAAGLQSTRDFVEAIQEGLVTLNIYGGPVDGDYGAGTKKAVARLQERCDIEFDGVFTVWTHLCLEDQLSA